MKQQAGVVIVTVRLELSGYILEHLPGCAAENLIKQIQVSGEIQRHRDTEIHITIMIKLNPPTVTTTARLKEDKSFLSIISMFIRPDLVPESRGGGGGGGME